METITFLRSFRICPFAIFDFAVSYLFMYFIAPYVRKIGINLNRKQLLWLTLPLSIVIHIVFNVMTPLTKMFLDPYGSYWLKIIILFMLVMSFLSRNKPSVKLPNSKIKNSRKAHPKKIRNK